VNKGKYTAVRYGDLTAVYFYSKLSGLNKYNGTTMSGIDLNQLRKVEIKTIIGTLCLEGTPDFLLFVRLAGDNCRFSEFDAYLKPDENYPLLRDAAIFLRRYFNGEKVSWAGKCTVIGTEFQRSVWHETVNIPYGETISYGELGSRVGHPKAARAVGTVMAMNLLPILIPCHRVIAANGGLGGFGGGLNMKRWLLRHEGVDI